MNSRSLSIENTVPKVALGLPVFNGASYLRDALESIQRQTFTDFEVIIVDNASEDETPEICQEFVESDPRFQYHRNDHNLGAARNFNRAFRLARSPYFKWCSHDDLILPRFLEECVRVLDENPETVLCFSTIAIVNSDLTPRRDSYSNNLRTGSDFSGVRFAELVLRRHGCFQIWGLMRSEVIRRTRLFSSQVHSDRILLTEIALQGRFHELKQDLFRLRHHMARSVKSLPLYERPHWFDTSKRARAFLPHWHLWVIYANRVWNAPIRWIETAFCFLILLFWPVYPKNTVKLLIDLLVAIAPSVCQFDTYLRNKVSSGGNRLRFERRPTQNGRKRPVNPSSPL